MRLKEALKTQSLIVGNGPYTTRLSIPKGQTIFDYIDTDVGEKELITLLHQDMHAAIDEGVPIIINTPTFRASRHFLNGQNIAEFNKKYIAFIKKVATNFSGDRDMIIIGAAIGPMGDAYSSAAINLETAKTYHREQIAVFKAAKMDYINAITFPNVNEVIAAATVAKEESIDISIGLVLNGEGTLIDGTPLPEVIQRVDAATDGHPLGYMICCTHSSIAEKLNPDDASYERLIGLLANGSALTRQELEKLKVAKADEPDQFAAALAALKNKFPSMKILIGCCGTSNDHLRAIVIACKPSKLGVRSRF